MPDPDLLLGDRRFPECFDEQNGSMLDWSPTSAFWLFNRVTNFAYMRYDMIAADIRKAVDAWENNKAEVQIPLADMEAAKLPAKKRVRYLTDYSVKTAQELFDRWSKLDKYLLIKYMDGNVKSEHADVLEYLDGPGTRHTLWTTATAAKSRTTSGSRATTKSGNAPWRPTTARR